MPKHLCTKLIVFAVVIGFWSGVAFAGSFSDEHDNWVGGLFLSRGLMIYRDFFSHHAPLPYVLAAPVAWMAQDQVIWFRVILSGIFLLCWWTLDRLVAKPLKPGVWLTFGLLAFFAARFNYHMWLAEAFITLAMVTSLWLLLSRVIDKQPRVGVLVLAVLLSALAMGWSNPVFVPAALILIGMTALILKQQAVLNRKSIPLRILIFLGLLGIAIPVWLWLTNSFQQFYWSVFTYNTTIYYPFRLVGESTSASWYQVALQPAWWLQQQLATGLDSTRILLQTHLVSVVFLVKGLTLSEFIAWISVAWAAWWEAVWHLDVVALPILVLIATYLIKRNPIAGVGYVLLLYSSAFRQTESFHLGPFYGLVFVGLAFSLVQAWTHGQKKWLIALVVSLAVIAAIQLPVFFKTTRDREPMIARALVARAELLEKHTGEKPFKLQLLTRQPIYYLLLPQAQPASTVHYYLPWFHASQTLRGQVETALQETNVDYVIADEDFVFAPELKTILEQQYELVLDYTYQRKAM